MPEAGSAIIHGQQPDGLLAAISRSDRKSATAAGQANSYIFDLKTSETKTQSRSLAPAAHAMWIGDAIYSPDPRAFQSLSYGVSSGKTAQVTNSKQWDVRWPSSDHEGRIVYEMNGELQVLDAKKRKGDADFDHRAGRWSGAPAQPHLSG